MKKIIVFENVNLSAPDVDDYDDNDDDLMMRIERKIRDCVAEWFLVRQLFVYSTTLRRETNRLLAFLTLCRHFYGL